MAHTPSTLSVKDNAAVSGMTQKPEINPLSLHHDGSLATCCEGGDAECVCHTFHRLRRLHCYAEHLRTLSVGVPLPPEKATANHGATKQTVMITSRAAACTTPTAAATCTDRCCWSWSQSLVWHHTTADKCADRRGHGTGFVWSLSQCQQIFKHVYRWSSNYSNVVLHSVLGQNGYGVSGG